MYGNRLNVSGRKSIEVDLVWSYSSGSCICWHQVPCLQTHTCLLCLFVTCCFVAVQFCFQVTFSPMRTGWMPKNGLIAIAGMIGAPFSAGRGAIQMPPVSTESKKEQEQRLLFHITKEERSPPHRGQFDSLMCSSASGLFNKHLMINI